MESSDELVIERLARMNGIRTIRISESLRRHRKSLDEAINPRKFFTVRADTMHPSPLACQVAATASYTAIESGPKTPLAPGRYDHEAVRIAESIGRGEFEPTWSASEIREAVLRRQGRFTEVRDSRARQWSRILMTMIRVLGLLCCSAQLGQIDDARANWRQVIRAKPDDLLTYVYLAALSDSDQARDYLLRKRVIASKRPAAGCRQVR